MVVKAKVKAAGSLAGCVSIKPTDGPSAWYLSMLAIDPRRQAEDLGRALLSEAENRIKAQGARRKAQGARRKAQGARRKAQGARR
jgi:ribosomal protein S18 acetylase RimI-like enzyme